MVSLRRATNSRRQNAEVGCCPVPKLRPGSSTTTFWPGSGLRWLQLGLSSSLEPMSIVLKCRFHDSAQSSFRTFISEILPGPTSNPAALTVQMPATACARAVSGAKGAWRKMETVALPVSASVYDDTAAPIRLPSNSLSASSASGVVTIERRHNLPRRRLISLRPRPGSASAVPSNAFATRGSFERSLPLEPRCAAWSGLQGPVMTGTS